MGDHALSRLALRGRNFPLLSSGSDQHGASCRTCLANVLMGVPNASAARRCHVFPNFVASHVLVDIGVLGAHIGPVTFQFFGHQHGQSRHRALTQFGACNADEHGVVRLYHHPVRDFMGGDCWGSQGWGRVKPQYQRPRHGRGLLKKLTTIRTLQRLGHACLQCESQGDSESGQVGKVPGSKMPLSTVLMLVWPQNAMLSSNSRWMICKALDTPSSPMAPKPYSMARPM